VGEVSSGGSGWYDPGYGYGGSPGYGYPARPRVTTRVTYEEPAERAVHVTHEVHHVIHKKKRKQLVAVVPAEPAVAVVAEPVAVVSAPGTGSYLPAGVGYEGSYVAVSGTPGRGSVHVVESGMRRSTLLSRSFSPYIRKKNNYLTKTTYIHTTVSSLGRYVFGSEISYNKPPPPACLG
jgi:hypothetical protein